MNKKNKKNLKLTAILLSKVRSNNNFPFIARQSKIRYFIFLFFVITNSPSKIVPSGKSVTAPPAGLTL